MEIPIGEVIDKHGGKLLLDAHGHVYDIELQFERSCATEHNRNKWVRAETVIESQIDYFHDGSEKAAELFSPVVAVDFEDNEPGMLHDGHHMELGGNFTLTIPHCFNPEQVDAAVMAVTAVAARAHAGSRRTRRFPGGRVETAQLLPLPTSLAHAHTFLHIQYSAPTPTPSNSHPNPNPLSHPAAHLDGDDRGR